MLEANDLAIELAKTVSTLNMSEPRKRPLSHEK